MTREEASRIIELAASPTWTPDSGYPSLQFVLLALVHFQKEVLDVERHMARGLDDVPLPKSPG